MALLLAPASGCSVDGDYGGTHFSCAGGEACPTGFGCRDGVCMPDGVGDDGGGDSAGDSDGASADASALPDADLEAPDAAPGIDGGACLGSPPIADDFDDGVAGPQWTPYHSGMAVVVEAGGQLIARPPDGQGGNRAAGYLAAAPVDGRDARTFVRVPVMVNVATTARAYFRMGTATDGVAFEQSNGDLRCLLVTGGVASPVVVVPYDADAHRYWQLREQGGTLTWETSADGASWLAQASMPSPAALAAATVDLGASTQGATSSPGEAHFDDLDTGPAACP